MVHVKTRFTGRIFTFMRNQIEDRKPEHCASSPIFKSCSLWRANFEKRQYFWIFFCQQRVYCNICCWLCSCLVFKVLRDIETRKCNDSTKKKWVLIIWQHCTTKDRPRSIHVWTVEEFFCNFKSNCPLFLKPQFFANFFVGLQHHLGRPLICYMHCTCSFRIVKWSA